VVGHVIFCKNLLKQTKEKETDTEKEKEEEKKKITKHDRYPDTTMLRTDQY